MQTQIDHAPVVRSHEIMTDQRIGEILTAVGNHENKALLLAAMDTGITYSSSDLTKLFNSIQGDEPAWRLGDNNRNPEQYCSFSLEPAGLVTHRVIDDEKGTVGFVAPEEGSRLGKAMSGHLLDFSLTHPDFSLQQIFGKTGTNADSGLRAPMVRINVFGELLTRDQPIKTSDVIPDKPGLASNHIIALANEGLLKLRTTPVGQAFIEYAAGDKPLEEVTTRPKKSELPQDIKEVVMMLLSEEGDETITIPQVIEALQLRNPKYLKVDPKDQERFSATVRGVLVKMTNKGFLKKTSEFSQFQHSLITLDDEQTQLLTDCLSLIYDMQQCSEEFVQAGLAKAKAIVEDPILVNQLVAKARQKSPFANRKSREQRDRLVLDSLAEQPGATVATLESVLEGSLSKHTIALALRQLENDGLLKREVDKRRVSWFVVRATMNDQE